MQLRIAAMAAAATHFCLVCCCVSLQAAAPFPGSNQPTHTDATGGADVVWRHHWCGVLSSLYPSRVPSTGQHHFGETAVDADAPATLLASLERSPCNPALLCAVTLSHRAAPASIAAPVSMPPTCCCSAAGHVCRSGRRHITGVLWCGRAGTPVFVAAGACLLLVAATSCAAQQGVCRPDTHAPLPLCMQARSLCCGWCAMRSCTGATSQTSRCTSRSECPAACLCSK